MIDPVPLAAHVEPPEETQVHVEAVSALGNESVTVAAVMAEGPRLTAVIV